MAKKFIGIVAMEDTPKRFVARLIELTLHHLIERTAQAENGYVGIFMIPDKFRLPAVNFDLEKSGELITQFVLSGLRYSLEVCFVDNVFNCWFAPKHLSVYLTQAESHGSREDHEHAEEKGAHVLIELLKVLSCLGPVYTCSDQQGVEGYKRLNVTPMSFVEGVRRGIIPVSVLEMKMWHDSLPEEAGNRISEVFDQFMGMTPAEVHDVLDNKEDLHKQRKLKEILSEKILSYDK